MSGVEVAGLVLGCLPLIIQGIEAYNEGLDPVKSFMRWERELPQCIRKLRNQHVHYAQTIRILLEPLTSEFELAEMMADPGSSALWKDTDMAEKLKDRLQESYQAYQHTISEIERITKKIASKLDLDRASELSRNDLEALIAANPKKANDKFEIKKRIRFGMSKKSIKSLLEELNECNKELERFTEKSEKIETLRKTSKPSFATRLQRIQGYAKNLHDSLAQSWSCSCKSDHQTSLQLEPRGDLYAAGLKKANISAGTCFTVSFSSTLGDSQPWSWQAAEIHIEEEDIIPAQLPPGKPPKISKTVSFSSPPPPYSAIDPEIDAKQALQEVKDLCASIQQLHKSAPCIGFSLDSKSILRGVYPVKATEKQLPSYELITLDDLLDRPPKINGRPAKLNKKERYSLALTLASATLQLNSTPWLMDQWSTKDIHFHRTSNQTRPADIDHPYVALKLTEISTVVPAQKSRAFHNKNTVLLALAVSLLELYFGTSAEKYQESENGPNDTALNHNPWSLCAVAYDWTEQNKEDLSAAFLTAVRHCLRCFNDPGASLQDSDFLQAAVESIVLPLQDELCQFLGKPVT